MGVVRSLSDFGVFIDLGGADGLVHISELAWFPVAHPSEVVKVGQEVEVKILRVDKQRERIGLSIKRVQPDPWSRVEEDYHLSELVEAVVTRVVDFGAFVRLRTGVEGLLHVSEMADITPDHPQSLVAPGDLLLLRVLRIEPERRRIGLSLRQVSEQEWAEWAAKYHQHQPPEPAAGEAPSEETPISEEELAFAPLASDVAEEDQVAEVGASAEDRPEELPALEGQGQPLAYDEAVPAPEAAAEEPAVAEAQGEPPAADGLEPTLQPSASDEGAEEVAGEPKESVA